MSAAVLLLALANTLTGGALTGQLESNIPLAAIPFAPEETAEGSWIFQLGLLGNGSSDNPQKMAGYDLDWAYPSLQGTGIVQYRATRHVRLFGGATLGRSVDLSSGAILQIQQAWILWEAEYELGVSWRTLDLDTLVETSSTRHPYVLQSDSRQDCQWSQFALRARTRHAGPWMELRLLPVFPVGETHASSDFGDNSFTLGAIGAGWNFALAKSREVTLGARMVGLNNGTSFQLLVQMQRVFTRS